MYFKCRDVYEKNTESTWIIYVLCILIISINIFVTCGEKLSRIILIAMYVAKVYLSLLSFVRKEHQN